MKSPKRVVRLLTIEQLEDRTLPSTFRWLGGGADSNWTTPGNWQLLQGSGVFPSVAGDFAQFTGTYPAAQTVLVDTSITVGELRLATLSNINIVGNGNTLTLDNSGGGASSMITAAPGRGANPIYAISAPIAAANTPLAVTLAGGTLSLCGDGSLHQGPNSAGMAFTIYASATLQLDNGVNGNQNDRLADNAGITLHGGTFSVLGASNTATAETVGSITLASGSSTITTQPAGSNGSVFLTSVSLSRLPGGTINFTGTGLNATVTPNSKVAFSAAPNALLVGTAGGGIFPFATVNNADLATYDTTANSVAPFTGYVTALAGAGPEDVVKLTTLETLASNKTVNALVLTGNGAVAQTASAVSLTLASGSLLNTAAAATISGGIVALGGAGEGVILSAPAAALTMNSLLSNNSLTVAGGQLNLPAANSCSGPIHLASGVLYIGNNVALGTGPLHIAAGTLQASTAVTLANSVVLANSALTLAGTNNITFTGNVTLSNPGSVGQIANVPVLTNTLNVTSTGQAVFANPGSLIGTGGLTISGTGNVALTGANAYTGGTFLTGGSVIVGNNSALGSGPVVITSGTFLADAGARSLANAVSLAGNATFAGSSFGGASSGGSSLTFTGPTTLAADTTLTVNGTAAFTGRISGGGQLTMAGQGTLNLANAANDYSGGTVLNAGSQAALGTLIVNNSLALGSGPLTLATGAIQAGPAVAIGNQLVLAGGFVAFSGANTLTFSNALSTNSVLGNTMFATYAPNVVFNVTLAGNGNLDFRTFAAGSTATMTKANSVTGSLLVTGGQLALAGTAGSLVASSGIVVNAGATLTLDNSTANSSDRVVDATPITLNAGTLRLLGNGVAASSETFGALLLGPGSSAVVSTPGSGQSNTLVFATLTRSAGATVNFGGAGLGTSANQLRFTAAPLLTNGLLPYATVGETDFASVTANTIVANTNFVTSFAAVTSPADNVKLTAADNVPAQNITINSLIISGAGLAVGGPGTLTLGSGALLAAGGAAAISADISLGGEGMLLTGNAATLNLASSVVGTSGLTVGGTGTLNLNRPASVTGHTTLAGGTLGLGTPNAIPGGNPMTLAAGTIANTIPVSLPNAVSLGSSASSSSALTFAGNSPLIFGGPVALNGFGATLTVSNDAGVTVQGVVGGPGSLTKAGQGTLALAAANSYTGATFVTQGVLNIQNNQALGSAVNAVQTITLGGTPTTAGTFKLSFNGSTSTNITYSSNPVNLQANIQGALNSLNTIGTNNTLVAAVNATTFTVTFQNALGAMNVPAMTGDGAGLMPSGGTVTVNPTVTGSPPPASEFVVVAAGATLQLQGSAGGLFLPSYKLTLNGNGVGGMGALQNLIGNNTFVAPSTVNANNVFVPIASIQLAAGTALSGEVGTLTVPIPITGAADLTKVGGGTLVLSGANTVGGHVAVNGGIVQLGHAAALGSNVSGATVAAGATLQITGAGTYAGESLTLAGDGLGLTTSGGLLLATGALANTVASTWTGSITLAGDATLSGANSTFTVSGNVTASGNLSKVGGGTIALAGATVLSGAANILAGTFSLSGGGTLSQAAALTAGPGAVFTVDNTSTNLPDRLGDAIPVFLRGATLNFLGTNLPGVSSTEALGAMTLVSGASTISVQNGSATSPATLAAASLQRTAGSTVHFASSSSSGTLGSALSKVLFTNLPTLTSGILPFATVQTPNVPALDFATYGTGGIAPFTGYVTNLAAAGPTDNVRLTAATTLTASKAINSLLIQGNVTLAEGNNTLTLGSGGLLATGGNTGTISGGTVAFAGAEGVLIGSTNATVSSTIAGTGGLTISGAGAITLNAANGYLGTTTYNGGSGQAQGTLLAGNVSAFGNTTLVLNGGAFGNSVASNFALANPVVLSGSVFGFGGTNVTELAGPISLTGNTTITGTTAAALSGVVSGSGSLSLTNGTVVMANANNTYSGGTNLGGGVLQLSASAVVSGGTLVSGPLGTGAVNLTAGMFANANSAVNTVSYLQSTVALHNPIVLINNSAGAVRLGGAMVNGGGDVELAGPMSVTGTNAIQATINQTLTISGVISGSGSLSVQATIGNAGTVVLSGGNTLTGGVSLSNTASSTGNVLTLANNSALGTGLFVMTSGTLQDDGVPRTIANPVEINLPIPGPLTRTINVTGTLTFTGLVGGNANFAKTGPGGLVLTNIHSRAGGLVINQGAVTLTSNGAVLPRPFVPGFSPPQITLNPGAVLTLDNASVANNANRIADAVPITLAGGTINFVGAAGAGSSESFGPLTLGLADANGNVVTAGSAAINSTTGSGGSALLTFASLARLAGTTINFSGSGTDLGGLNNNIQFATPPQTVSVNGGNILPYATVTGTAAGRMDFATVTGSSIAPFAGYFTGDIDAASATDVVKLTTSGTTTLTADKQLAGLLLSGDGIVLAGGTGITTLTLGPGGSGAIAPLLSTDPSQGGAGNNVDLNLALAGEGIVVSNSSPGLAVNGQMSHAASSRDLTVSGPGTLLLGANNSNGLPGTIALNSGTLQLGNALALDAAGQSTLSVAGGALQAAIANPVIPINMVLTMSGGSLNVSGANSLAFGGKLSGPGGLTVNLAAARTLTLTASASVASVNTFTGATTVNSGTLALGVTSTGSSTNATALAGPVVVNGGTLTVTTAFNQLNSQNVTITNGTLALGNNPATINGLMLAGGSVTGAGPLTIRGSVTTLPNSNPSAIATNVVLSPLIQNNVATAFNIGSFSLGSNDLTISGAISGSNIAFVKAGSGRLTLAGSAANTFTGQTTVNAGTLQLAMTAPVNAYGGALVIRGSSRPAAVLVATNNSQLNSSGAVVVGGTQATLDISASATPQTINAAIDVRGGLIATGANTLNVGGTITGIPMPASTTPFAYSPATITGRLALAATQTIAVVDVGTATGLHVEAQVAGNGGITKTGAGTLRMNATATNTFVGVTTINLGTLLVNAAQTASAVTVQSGATLGGNGSTGPVTVMPGGTISPGDPALAKGTMTSTSLDLSPGGNLTLQVADFATPGFDFDRNILTATGAALTLGGSSSLTLDLAGLAGDGGAAIILFANGTAAGGFASVNTINNPFGLVPVLDGSADPHQIFLRLTAPATSLRITVPATAMAGASIPLTVTALNQFNNVASSFAGTVHFGGTDLSANLPANSVLTGGAGTFMATLKTAGIQTIIASDMQADCTAASTSVTVSAAPASQFLVTAPAIGVAANVVVFTVTAQDPFNNPATAYGGTVRFSSSDGQAVLPNNTTLTSGIGLFAAVLNTAGSQTLNASDTVTSSISGCAPIAVLAVPGPATHFSLGTPANSTAGNVLIFTVTAQDQFNATATSFNGAVHIASSDSQAGLSGNANLTNGVGFFAAVLKTAGTQTLTATAAATPSISGVSGPLAVNAGSVVRLAVATPATAYTDNATRFTVTAQDFYNNTATTYAGTVHFTSSDSAAIVPGDAPLNAGKGTFTATFKTTGNHTLTAADSGNVSGTSANMVTRGFVVTQLTPNATGFTVQFSKPFEPSAVNLYTAFTAQAADVKLNNGNVNQVSFGGSVVIDPGNASFTFVKTGGVLANSVVVIGATAASPIRITTRQEQPHGFSTGDSVTIAGVNGNDAANGNWVIDRIDDSNFTLRGSAGSGTFTASPNAAATGPARYTVVLRSAADGFKDANGILLDGNSDGVVGDNFSFTFTVNNASGTPVLSIPDFARGPDAVETIAATITAAGNTITRSGPSSVNVAVTFARASTGDTITRADGSWQSDGWAAGQVVTVSGARSNLAAGPSNNRTFHIAGVTDTALTLVEFNSVSSEGPVNASFSTGSWVSDGFLPGQTLLVSGTTNNNGSFTIASVNPTTMTLSGNHPAVNQAAAAATLSVARTLRVRYDAGNARQVVSFDGAPTDGTFALTFAGVATGPITYSTLPAALVANIQDAVNAAFSANTITTRFNMLVSGDNATAVTITLQRDLGGAGQPTMSASGSFTGGSSPSVLVATTVEGVATGVPITLANASNVTDATFQLAYDPNLLAITGAMNAGVNGTTFTLLSAAAGVASFSFHASSPQAGVLVLGQLIANVPASAASLYTSKELLHLSNIKLNGSPAGVLNDDGVHVVAYVDDATGDGALSAGDSSAIGRVVSGIDNSIAQGTVAGFASYRLADPVILADVNHDGLLQPFDQTQLNKVLVSNTLSNPQSQVPLIPVGVATTSPLPHPDPTLSLPTDLHAVAGGTVVVPINIDTARPEDSTGMLETVLALRFDPRVFTVSAADVQVGSLPLSSSGGWRVQAAVNQSTGEIGIDLYGTTPIQTRAGGSLVTITMHVLPTAPAGATALNLVPRVTVAGRDFQTMAADTVSTFVLHPEVTDSAADAGVDGSVIVATNSVALATASVQSIAVATPTLQAHPSAVELAWQAGELVEEMWVPMESLAQLARLPQRG